MVSKVDDYDTFPASISANPSFIAGEGLQTMAGLRPTVGPSQRVHKYEGGAVGKMKRVKRNELPVL